jgi:hypothetical protein
MTPEELKRIREVQDMLEATAREMFRPRITIHSNTDFGLPFEVRVLDGFHQAHSTADEMQAWCQRTWLAPWDLDNASGVWCYDGQGVFNFKNLNDRNTFVLRWA